ncbi:Ig-like domain-containing protein [Leucothrix mucor]|uniref:Ig-like domain-containing protein n=1 Tax=Leucothrix mucor TaxID=45248 RepID=UPI000A070564|nr:Ig-like domain-containing protein [Leucothrix mucor]
MKSLPAVKRMLQLIMLGIVAWGFVPSSQALAAEHCADNYYIDQTLASGARWDMCWTHNNNHGIRYHHVYYTPVDGTRRMVLMDAAVAQIHVPYDDNGARYHDVSDYGLGGGYLRSISNVECPGGQLRQYGTKNAVCTQVVEQGAAYRSNETTAKANALKVFSISKVGAYVYIPQWLFFDDGRMEPSMVATGSLQRINNTSIEPHGWLLSALAGNTSRIGLSHMHNYFWRLDFDLNGTANNDIASEINYVAANGKRQRSMTTFSNEVSRSVSPTSQRSWVISDGSQRNDKNHALSYEIRLSEAGHREQGPAYEPFTYNDFYVTRANNCEQIASHNQRINSCGTDSVDQFANNETLSGQDLVAWVGISFYHMPRSEDYPRMDAHTNKFEIIPRDWHTQNPLKTINTTPLVANEDSATTAAGVAVTIDVLANDTGSGVVFNELNDPANGSAVISNGKVVYTPDAGFAGTEIFWYSVRDISGALFGTKITVTVTGVNLNEYPVANPDSVTTARDTGLQILPLSNDTGAGLTITQVNNPSFEGGTVTVSNNQVSYTPPVGFAGTDTFWYAFEDSQGRSNSAPVTIEVTGVDVSAYPVGNPDTVTAYQNTALTIDVLANDTGAGLVIDSSNPYSLKGGSVAISNNKLLYTPAQDYVGSDNIWYVFKDSLGRSNSSVVNITVEASAPAYPVAITDSASTARNTSLTINVLANDTGAGLSISEVNTNSVNGATVSIVNNQLNYVPYTGFTGNDSFWYAISDSLGRLNAAQVNVTVTP